MDTNLQGRLKNLTLPKKNGLIPLFEAVVNSIQAIEDRFTSPADISDKGRIDIYIRREPEQPSLDLGPGRKPERPIIGFEVVDNGVGFTRKNWEAFNRLDFTFKIERGCGGVGRLTWLKTFDDVKIESLFHEGGAMRTRSFDFSRDKEVSGGELFSADADTEPSTHVYLLGFRAGYAGAVEKTADAIASRLLEHTLWYFVPTLVFRVLSYTTTNLSSRSN